MRIKWELIWDSLPALLNAAGYTLAITACAVAIGVVLGLTVAICRINRRWWLRFPATVYVEIFRGTPMLVQIYLAYFVILPILPYQPDDVLVWLDQWAQQSHQADNLRALLADSFLGFLIPVTEFLFNTGVCAGIVALGLNSGAYLGEIFRGGILAVDRGQREAALSLGMTESQVFRHVLLPQAFVNALPAVANEFVTLIKDSSLVSAITVMELTQQALIIGAREFQHFTMLTGIAIIYFAMTFTTSRGLAWLEKRLRIP